jgi:hypothetical protein
LEAGVPLEERFTTDSVRGLFGRYKTVQVKLADAWPVGTFNWRVHESSSRGPRRVTPTGVTSDGSVVPMDEDEVAGGLFNTPTLENELDWSEVVQALGKLLR